MNVSQIVIQGTLQPDGTLVLNETPKLPPGPVEVLIRARPVLADDGLSWWDFLQKARSEMMAQGYKFRTKDEIDAERARQRSADELRKQSLDRRGE